LRGERRSGARAIEAGCGLRGEGGGGVVGAVEGVAVPVADGGLEEDAAEREAEGNHGERIEEEGLTLLEFREAARGMEV
jgi:hypothetical protein